MNYFFCNFNFCMEAAKNVIAFQLTCHFCVNKLFSSKINFSHNCLCVKNHGIGAKITSVKYLIIDSIWKCEIKLGHSDYFLVFFFSCVPRFLSSCSSNATRKRRNWKNSIRRCPSFENKFLSSNIMIHYTVTV